MVRNKGFIPIPKHKHKGSLHIYKVLQRVCSFNRLLVKDGRQKNRSTLLQPQNFTQCLYAHENCAGMVLAAFKYPARLIAFYCNVHIICKYIYEHNNKTLPVWTPLSSFFHSSYISFFHRKGKFFIYITELYCRRSNTHKHATTSLK